VPSLAWVKAYAHNIRYVMLCYVFSDDPDEIVINCDNWERLRL